MSASTGADVVFVSHEATRTGAPVGLVQLLGWLGANTDLDVEVVLVEGGPLADDFAAVARVRSLDEVLTGPPPKVLFLNSSFSARVLLASTWPGTYVIARVPELELAFDEALPVEVRTALLARADRYVAVADRVRRHLVEGHGVSDEAVTIVHGSVPLDHVEVGAEAVAAARLEAGVPPDAPLVGAVGSRSWRKGADLFLELAVELRRRRPAAPTHFLWLGSDDRSWQFGRFADDVARAGLSDRLHLLADHPEPAPFQRALDVFALTSREDPFPRVAVEAAALGRPIAAFDSGGVEELLARAGIEVVPYGDVSALADQVLHWLDHPDQAAAVGEQLARAVREHHTLSVSAPLLLAEIERGLAG